MIFNRLEEMILQQQRPNNNRSISKKMKKTLKEGSIESVEEIINQLIEKISSSYKENDFKLHILGLSYERCLTKKEVVNAYKVKQTLYNINNFHGDISQAHKDKLNVINENLNKAYETIIKDYQSVYAIKKQITEADKYKKLGKKQLEKVNSQFDS